MKQMEPVNTLKVKNLDPAEYTKTLLYEGVRIGMINKNNLETFQKHLSALLTRQISHYTKGGKLCQNRNRRRPDRWHFLLHRHHLIPV